MKHRMCVYPDGLVGRERHIGERWVCPDCGTQWELVEDIAAGPMWRWDQPNEPGCSLPQAVPNEGGEP